MFINYPPVPLKYIFIHKYKSIHYFLLHKQLTWFITHISYYFYLFVSAVLSTLVRCSVSKSFEDRSLLARSETKDMCFGTRRTSSTVAGPAEQPCAMSLVWFSTKTSTRFFEKKSRMHEILNEIYLQNYFRDGYNFSRRI